MPSRSPLCGDGPSALANTREQGRRPAGNKTRGPCTPYQERKNTEKKSAETVAAVAVVCVLDSGRRGTRGRRRSKRRSPQPSRRPGPQERPRPGSARNDGPGVSLSSFCGGGGHVAVPLPPVCWLRPVLGPAAVPTGKPTAFAAERLPAPPPTRPGNAKNGFRGLFPLSFFGGGKFSEAGSWRCYVSVCWRRDASAGSPAGVFPDPTAAAWGTQITYVRHIPRVEMVYGHENKGDWLRAGFDGQAGGARSFAGSAGREDSGNGNGSRCRASGRDC